jgi:hypothetical protein
VADTVVVLSERDAVTLKSFLDRLRRDTEKVSTSRDFKDDSDYLPPEVYLAKVPPGGIPAASGDTLGSADCDIYRAIPSSGGQTEKLGYSKTIYNPGSTAAPADSLALVARDKFGSWYCLGQGGGGSGLSGITVEGIALIPSAPASSPVTGVTTLDFDPNVGFVISSPSSGLAQITVKSAGVSNYGVVTNSLTTAQTFAGDKYFQNQVQFNSKIVGVSDYSQSAPSGARYVLSQQGGQGETDGILWGFEGSLFSGTWTIAGSGNLATVCNTASYMTGGFLGTRISTRLGNEQSTLFGIPGTFTQFPGFTLIMDANAQAVSNGLTHCYKISDPATPSTVYPGLWQVVTVGSVNLVFKGGIFVGTSTTAGATTTAAATTTTTTAAGATTTTTTQATTTTTAGGGGGLPTITSVSPSTAPHGTPTSITITGTNFTGATSVKFGPTPAQSFTVNSSTQITATTPFLANAQTASLTVTTSSGTSSGTTFTFT